MTDDHIEAALEHLRESVAAIRERVARLEQAVLASTDWQDDFDRRRLKELIPNWQALWISRALMGVVGAGALYAVSRLIETLFKAMK